MSALSVENLYYDDIDFPGDTEPGNEYDAYEEDIWQTPLGLWHEHTHGEFNLHIFNSIGGLAPTDMDYYEITGLPDFELSLADHNEDNLVSFTEAYDWNWHYNSRFYSPTGFNFDDPQLSDYGGFGATTSLKYPTIINSDITTSASKSGIIGIPVEVHVTSGSTLTFSNARINLDYEGKLVIDQGATLIIGENVIINSVDDCQLVINGYLGSISNTSFTEDDGKHLTIEFNTSDSPSFLYDIFLNCHIVDKAYASTYMFCDFTDCDIIKYDRTLTIFTGTFSRSYVQGICTEEVESIFSVANSEFEGEMMNCAAIDVENYSNFSIVANEIEHYREGIYVSNSGYGQEYYRIWNNQVVNIDNRAVVVYHSDVDMTGNGLGWSQYGLVLYDRSNANVWGNKNAAYPGETQRFISNTMYEVYSLGGSFPHTFTWNAVVDEDNTEPMVYTTGQEGPFDVSCNYWGDNFDPEEDLYPWPGYEYEPIWIIPGECHVEEQAEQIFNSAMSEAEAGNYIVAETGLKQLVSEFPLSKFAKASLKVLYKHEKYAGNDYQDLINYYNNNQTIQSLPELSELADFLANFCEIKLENWPAAIAWFENVIQNPPSLEDSIFAIIDLSYTYFLMQNGGYKSTYTGAMSQYKFETYQQYEKNRDDLLALLMPQDNMSKTFRNGLSALQGGQLMQNVPNPFTSRTDIYYKLDIPSDVSIKIYNVMGQMVCELNEGAREGGTYRTTFDATGMPAGMYYCSMQVNGKVSDSKKMLVN